MLRMIAMIDNICNRCRVSIGVLIAFTILAAPACAQSDSFHPACPRNCKYPLKKLNGSPLDISSDTDPIFASWNSRARYYLVMGVQNVPSGAEDRDFAKADVSSLVEVLCAQGFRPLPNSPYMSELIGKDATQTNLEDEITEYLPAINASNHPLLLFYYSGHGQVDLNATNLILWAANAKTLEPRYAFSLREEVRKIRASYSGDLLIILDACYSGQAFHDLATLAFDDRTAVLASSSDDQESEALKISAKDEQPRSAFTYALTEVLRGSTDPCDEIKTEASPICKISLHDGVLGMTKLQTAIRIGLQRLPLQHRVDPLLKVFPKDPVGMVGYFCETVAELDTPERESVNGMDRVLSLINNTGLRSFDNEALGITDKAGRLLAVMTVHKSKGAVPTTVQAVTVDALTPPQIRRSLKDAIRGVAPYTQGMVRNKSALQIVRFPSNVSVASHGPYSFQVLKSFSDSDSKDVLASLSAQVAFGELNQAKTITTANVESWWVDAELQKSSATILVNDVRVLPDILITDSRGTTVFPGQAEPLVLGMLTEKPKKKE